MINKVNDRILEAVLSSPMAREADERHQAAVIARRVELAKERAAMEKAAATAFHAHEAAVEKAMAAHAAAVAELRSAEAAMNTILAARIGENHRFNVRVGAIEAELRSTADPAIDAFISEMRDAFDVALKTHAAHEGMLASRHPVTGEVELKQGPPRVRPADRAQAIREAIAAAEGLKLLPKQDKVAEQIAAIRASLPVIGNVVGAND